MSNQTASAPATKTDQIYKTVARQVVKIQHGYIKRTSSAVAELAALRNCPLDRPGRDPQVWALTLADLPPNLQGKATPHHSPNLPCMGQSPFTGTTKHLWSLACTARTCPSHPRCETRQAIVPMTET